MVPEDLYTSSCTGSVGVCPRNRGQRVFSHLVTEVAPRNFQVTGGFGLHSVGHLKGAFEQRAFEAGHDFPQIETLGKQRCKLLHGEFTIGRAERRPWGLQMEILRLQFSLLAQDQSRSEEVP